MFVFNSALAKTEAQKRAMANQYAIVNANRDDSRHALPAEMFANAGKKPLDLYREWDDQTITQFRLDEGDNILNALMPLARSLPIGRTILEGARSSDAGKFTQSMSGETGSIFDNVDYDSDKTLVPISQNGFKRNWREGEQLSLEDFDDASIQQMEAIRTHRQGVIGSFMDGHKDQNGQFIVEDGVSWQGVRNDPRVDQIDLGAGGLNVDLSSSSTTGDAIYKAFLELSRIRTIDNKVSAPATYFVSPEIYFNMQRPFSDQYDGGSIMKKCMEIVGITEFVMSSVLTGNQTLSFPLSSQFVQPLVGMGVSTIALPRPTWSSPFAFEVVSAIGWNIRTDFGSTNRAVQYAAS